MSTYDDDLLAALRRAADPVDRHLADALAGLVRESRQAVPPANEALAAFLAESVSPAAHRAQSDLPDVAGSESLGPAPVSGPPNRRHRMKSSLLVPIEKVAKLGLVAKVMLAGTVAFASAGTVAATTALTDNGGTATIVTPASDSTTEPADDAVEDHHEGVAHEGTADDDVVAPTPVAPAPATTEADDQGEDEQSDDASEADDHGDDEASEADDHSDEASEADDSSHDESDSGSDESEDGGSDD